MTEKKGAYRFIQYNPELKEKARQLRKVGNYAEMLLWGQLKGKKLNGLRFTYQKPIGCYIVDFFCHARKVIIEVDGSSHANKVSYDKERDKFLRSLGYEVIHILDSEVQHNLSGVMEFLSLHPSLSR